MKCVYVLQMNDAVHSVYTVEELADTICQQLKDKARIQKQKYPMSHEPYYRVDPYELHNAPPQNDQWGPYYARPAGQKLDKPSWQPGQPCIRCGYAIRDCQCPVIE